MSWWGPALQKKSVCRHILWWKTSRKHIIDTESITPSDTKHSPWDVHTCGNKMLLSETSWIGILGFNQNEMWLSYSGKGSSQIRSLFSSILYRDVVFEYHRAVATLCWALRPVRSLPILYSRFLAGILILVVFQNLR